jgi:hypothetical protein
LTTNDESRPDALIVPEERKSGSRQIDRINSILDLAEPILEVDRTRGDRGYIRRQPGGTLFITRNPADTLLYPIGHPREGQPRYRWADAGDGIQRGFLEERDHAGPA